MSIKRATFSRSAINFSTVVSTARKAKRTNHNDMADVALINNRRSIHVLEASLSLTNQSARLDRCPSTS